MFSLGGVLFSPRGVLVFVCGLCQEREPGKNTLAMASKCLPIFAGVATVATVTGAEAELSLFPELWRNPSSLSGKLLFVTTDTSGHLICLDYGLETL